MKRFIGWSALVRMIVLVSGILVLFSCMEEDDMREKTVKELGEPDEIQSYTSGAYEYEYYFYDRKDINRVYVYEKSAPGCGSDGNWYVSTVYVGDLYFDRTLYEPPVINHTPVKTAGAGQQLTLVAKITDDIYIKNAILHYRIPTEAEFLPMTMSVDDSAYFSADIPAERMTTAGIEYYIQATDDADHSSRLPEREGTYTIVVSAGAAKTMGTPQTTVPPVAPKYVPSYREKSDIPL